MSGGKVALSAPAKVNLALHVTGRRDDGYHLIDSIAIFTDLGDSVGIAPADDLSLKVSGRFAAHAPGDESDLAWRAAEAFFLRTGLHGSAAISIEKNIPAGAGLGGGSADAAAVLKGLNDLYGSPASAHELDELGLTLGADVPMCLAGRVLRASGVGEQITPVIGWPALPIVLVWPGKPVSTAACFSALARRDNAPLPCIDRAETPAEVALWLSECRNDLESPALTLAPEIGHVLTRIKANKDCLMARMSGSGSACFGLFPSAVAASIAAAELESENFGWWVTPTLARCDQRGRA